MRDRGIVRAYSSAVLCRNAAAQRIEGDTSCQDGCSALTFGYRARTC